MFGLPDITTVAIIEKRLQDLANNRAHLEYIMCSFSRHPILRKYVGGAYVKDAIDFVANNKISVFPYYSLDLAQGPSIAVVSSHSENQQYIGDYGHENKITRTQPILIAEWDALSYDGPVLNTSPAYELNKKLWKGLSVTNSGFISKIDGITESGDLCLIDDIPSDIPLKGWKAQTGGSDKFYLLGASTDNVEISCQLTSNGDASVHRLLSMLLRYILKSSRPLFNELGLQNTRISSTPIVVSEQESLLFQSVFNIECVCTDFWIDREVQGMDPGFKQTIGIIATNGNPPQDVVLE